MRGVVLGLAVALALVAGCPGVASAAGRGWMVQPVPLSGQASIGGLSTVSCLSADDCLAGGDQYGDGAQPLLGEQWDGSSWQAFEFAPAKPEWGNAQVSQVLCVTTSNCFMVGFSLQGSPARDLPLAEHWDGRTWTIQTFPVASGVGALYGISCPAADDCLAVGAAGYAKPGATAPLAEHWDGSSWSQQPIPGPRSTAATTRLSSSLLSVSCVSGSNCTAVGEIVDGPPLAEHWNGSRWAIRRAPAPAGEGWQLQSVSCPKAGFCLATGSGIEPGSGYSMAFTEMWDGHDWSLQAIPMPAGTYGSELDGISCVSAIRCTAAGDVATLPMGAKRARALAEYWTGSSWAIQPTAQPQAHWTLSAISCTGPRVCTAVGSNYQSGQPIAENENQ